MLESSRLTQDGSYTFFSAEFGEAYHAREGAKAEAFEKFAGVTELEHRANQGSVKILDICYGLGYNSAAALETIWQTDPNCQIELLALELDPKVLLAALSLKTFQDWSLPVQTVLSQLAQTHTVQQPNLQAELLIGDARQSIQRVMARYWQADVIFLDPFSPRRCPQLWTVEFLTDVAACLAADGMLATYSRSASVRAALLASGLYIGTVTAAQAQPHTTQAWSQGTIARFSPQGLTPLSEMEEQHLLSRAGVPLRDPSKSESADWILAQQAEAQQASDRESTSSWRRRWHLSKDLASQG
jgi:tRNA U34 5-methylaminomethyl-2-thiouridine-forming methyltransferase MnmC